MINSDKEILGREGETRAVSILKDWGFILSRPDFIGHMKETRLFYGEEIAADEDIEFEIKTKAEPFVPGPGCSFYGHGTDVYQIEKRLGRYKKYGFKLFLLIIQEDGKIYGQWLHVLERGIRFDTKYKKRIYPLESFITIPDIFGNIDKDS